MKIRKYIGKRDKHVSANTFDVLRNRLEKCSELFVASQENDREAREWEEGHC
jgi:ferritin